MNQLLKLVSICNKYCYKQLAVSTSTPVCLFGAAVAVAVAVAVIVVVFADAVVVKSQASLVKT